MCCNNDVRDEFKLIFKRMNINSRLHRLPTTDIDLIDYKKIRLNRCCT